MTGIEVNFVVPDSLKALALYERIFEVERLEVSDFPAGTNEVVFSMDGTRVHLLDENPAYHLVAPREGQSQSMWLNVLVPDIQQTFDRAMQAGCKELHAVTRMDEMGLSNAIFQDPFGYVWMLHQVHRVVSFEERTRILKQAMASEQD